MKCLMAHDACALIYVQYLHFGRFNTFSKIILSLFDNYLLLLWATPLFLLCITLLDYIMYINNTLNQEFSTMR